MNVPIVSYLNCRGELSSSYDLSLSDAILERGYRVMRLTRHVEERMVILQRQGRVTFALTSKGEEACAVASAAALKAADWMYPQYREAGIAFWRGMSIPVYVNNMFGNAADLMKGRQMPTHFGSRELNIVTVSSPIATQIPHAAGAAYAMKLLKEEACAICYCSDGASSEGDFHAGLNFAAVLKAPVIYFCRNNGYAISTSTERQFVTDGVAPKSIGNGIKTFRVDGNDFFAVYEVVSEARRLCLNGEGPIFIEAMTYRLGPHTTSDDPGRYRSQEEVAVWEKRCPISRLGAFLIEKGLWNEEKESSFAEKIKTEVDEAIEKAQAIPKPSLRTMFEDVWQTMPPRLVLQYEEMKRLFSENN